MGRGVVSPTRLIDCEVGWDLGPKRSRTHSAWDETPCGSGNEIALDLQRTDPAQTLLSGR